MCNDSRTRITSFERLSSRKADKIQWHRIAFVQYANAMNLIFQLKNEREKKDENSE